jgi:hypothetical protein
MSDESAPDEILTILPEGSVTDKIHVDSLRVRDRVVMRTSECVYLLAVGKNSHCILNSTNPSEKSGQIILRGGTNADVTEYTPNRIFVGGRLAYVFDEEASSLVTTSVIESLAYEPGLR